MKGEAQRIAIAEACGWKWAEDVIIHTYSFSGSKGSADGWMSPEGTISDDIEDLPDYLNDLNAMHEAEKLLIRIYEPPSAHKEYDTKLWVKMRDDGLELNGFTWHATAAQRAEAFLKTIGKWKDDNET